MMNIPTINAKRLDIVIANVSALAISNDEESWYKEFEVDMMHSDSR